MSSLMKMPGKHELSKNHKNAISRWSYSKLSCYETCPKQFYYQYVAKLKPFVKSPAMERGLDIHDKAEKFVTGQIKRMPKELKIYSDEFIELRDAGGTKELDYSYTKDWEPTEWNSWSDVWCIAKPDSTCQISDNEGVYVDYKTGKVYDTHKDQCDTYALASFIHMPNVEFLTGEFWYLDQEDEEPGVWEYERSVHFAGLKRMFTQRVSKMVKDTKFQRKKSFKCNWCDFNVKKGGPCDPG